MKNYLFFFLTAGFFISCSEHNKYDIQSDDKYQKSEKSIEETEMKNPAAFLAAKGDEKKNIIGQTVVKGEIVNSAKIVTYKDVNLQLSFYSKTGAILEQDVETIYEAVDPGETKSFKSKYFTPKGTDSVGMRVLGAKF